MQGSLHAGNLVLLFGLFVSARYWLLQAPVLLPYRSWHAMDMPGFALDEGLPRLGQGHDILSLLVVVIGCCDCCYIEPCAPQCCVQCNAMQCNAMQCNVY